MTTVEINPMDIRKEKALLVKSENMNSRPLIPATSMDNDAPALNNKSL